MDIKEQSLKLHLDHKGKMATCLTVPLENKEDLSLAYTPGVAAVCETIAADKTKLNDYTNRGNLVAIVTDGSAVLGLGNIGPEGAYPVMEGKAALFKKFGGVDAISICLNTQDPQEIIKIVKSLEPTFGGINLEDISAPRCFEIEETLIKEMNIPIFHDDQHGTAIVVLAGLINALKLTGKNKETAKVVLSGAGAAGMAITKLLFNYGFKNIILNDSKGPIYVGREDFADNLYKQKIAEITNLEKINNFKDSLKGADIFIGVSKANLLTADDIKLMNEQSIIFAMANPVPEIMPEEAKKGGAFVVATGRSDFSNQINNVLAFPGLFRGVLDAKILKITDQIKIAAAEALANLIADSEISPDYIIPNPFDERVAKAVSEAVKQTVQ